MVRLTRWVCMPLLALAVLALSSCKEGVRVPTQETVELPIAVKDKQELASLLSDFAGQQGLYFQDASDFEKDASNGTVSIWMTIYRPLRNGKEWPEIGVYSEGSHSPWVTFSKSLDQSYSSAADQTREALLAKMQQRWPNLSRVPILPDGGLPLQRDVRRTPEGLRIDASRADVYETPHDSPLLTKDL